MSFEDLKIDSKRTTIRGVEGGFIYIAKQKFSGQELRILFYILGNLDWNNRVLVSQKDITEDLEIHTQSVSSAMRKFVKIGLLEERGRVNLLKRYQLNPQIARKRRYWQNVLSN